MSCTKKSGRRNVKHYYCRHYHYFPFCSDSPFFKEENMVCPKKKKGILCCWEREMKGMLTILLFLHQIIVEDGRTSKGGYSVFKMRSSNMSSHSWWRWWWKLRQRDLFNMHACMCVVVCRVSYKRKRFQIHRKVTNQPSTTTTAGERCRISIYTPRRIGRLTQRKRVSDPLFYFLLFCFLNLWTYVQSAIYLNSRDRRERRKRRILFFVWKIENLRKALSEENNTRYIF